MFKKSVLIFEYSRFICPFTPWPLVLHSFLGDFMLFKYLLTRPLSGTLPSNQIGLYLKRRGRTESKYWKCLWDPIPSELFTFSGVARAFVREPPRSFWRRLLALLLSPLHYKRLPVNYNCRHVNTINLPTIHSTLVSLHNCLCMLALSYLKQNGCEADVHFSHSLCVMAILPWHHICVTCCSWRSAENSMTWMCQNVTSWDRLLLQLFLLHLATL